ncbi:MAG: hypothetical protein ACU836_13295 [Gammaproteobacteria bacterium]
MAKLDEFFSLMKSMDSEKLASAFKELLSNPEELAIVAAVSAFFLILLGVWILARSRRDEEDYDAEESNASSISSEKEQPNRQYSAGPRTFQPVSSQMGASAPTQTRPGNQAPLAQQQVSEIPQDSVLRRHYLGNEVAKDSALHDPYPSDSVLRRHYDTAHKLVVDISKTAVEKQGMASGKSSAVSLPLSTIPEDSVLRRHYLANEAAMKAALREPYPTDSVLRRHYDAAHKIRIETESIPVAASVSVQVDVPVSDKPVQRASSIEAAFDKAVESAQEFSESEVRIPFAKQSRIPEDSVLKRHFIAQLQAEIEAALCPRPTDSVLRRHYDCLVGYELERRLAS